MATFTETGVDLDKIGNSLVTIRTRLKNAKSEFTKAQTNLQALGTTYSDTITTLNAQTNDNPAWEVKKSELALMVTEYQGMLTDISVAISALDPLTEF